jgi:hypothetical protein
MHTQEPGNSLPEVFWINATGPRPTIVAALIATTYSLVGFRLPYVKLFPSLADTCVALVQIDSGPYSRIHKV